MRRWNGWGEEGMSYPFPNLAAHYLVTLIGEGTTYPDITLEEALALIPLSRLPSHNLIHIDPLNRLRHARGQSLPDWIAMRSGFIGTFPDGVAYPENEKHVRTLLDYVRQVGACLIPYGGGTSVVGHINPTSGNIPVLTLDLSRFNQLTNIDETSYLASFGAGVSGPDLEGQLNKIGYTLGHFPQSFELSTLGGWVATRSSGQQSYYYGRIEDLFAGGRVETPIGPLNIPPLPASAAGPDLRQAILGSEGRLGVITNVTIRIRPLPEVEAFYGVFFQSWESGIDAVREITQSRVAISMARLSDPQETETTLALSGKESLVTWADRGLRLLRYGPQRCLLIFGITGDRRMTRLALRQANAISRAHGGLPTGTTIGNMWRKSRFLTPYLRNTLWERGYALDTLETALPWSKVLPAAKAIKSAIQEGLSPHSERVLVFSHLSHVYRDGASIYVTYLYRRSKEAEQTLNNWKILKTAASQVIIAHGGTISHQHGVGLDHAPYLKAEKGPVGMTFLNAAAEALDPDCMLNPGKLLAKR